MSENVTTLPKPRRISWKFLATTVVGTALAVVTVAAVKNHNRSDEAETAETSAA